MQVVYTQESPPETFSKSIFLAGPTPRSEDTKTWRTEALEILASLGYDGVVYVPEARNGDWTMDYEDQVAWELKYRTSSDVLLFWVPRELESMPAFTTNIEFGEDLYSNRIFYGRPDWAAKCKYLDSRYELLGKNVKNNLEDLLLECLNYIGEGSSRTAGETTVPLFVWRSPMFQNWYTSHTKLGNKLEDCKVLTSFVINNSFLFSYNLWVKIWIESEQRYKENEFVFSRTDTSSIVAYKSADKLSEYEIVLVKEFRSPVRNIEGMVFECPGGSSFKPKEDPKTVAQHEIEEETGLFIDDKDRFKLINDRQVAATLSSHHTILYAIELTEDEMNSLKESQASKKTFGVKEDSESTSIFIFKLGNIKDVPIDWTNAGMIFEAIMT